LATLNQIINQLQTIAADHKQINTFRFDDLFEFLVQRESVIYPLFGIELDTGSIEEKEIRYDLTMYFLDKVTTDNLNRYEVESDMVQIAHDVITKIRNNPDLNFRLSIKANYPIEFFNAFTEDNCAGVKLTVPVYTDADFNKCLIPE